MCPARQITICERVVNGDALVNLRFVLRSLTQPVAGIFGSAEPEVNVVPVPEPDVTSRDTAQRCVDCGPSGRDSWRSLVKVPQAMTPVRSPKPEPPNLDYEYYVDYCVFFGSSPRPFEQFSDDFNILGRLGRWQGKGMSLKLS